MTGTSRSARIERRAAPALPGEVRGERHGAAEVDERNVAVEHPRQLVDTVDVGAQSCGGLRSADRDEPFDHKAAQGIQALATAVGTDGHPGLGEDVVGEGVAGMDEGAVALGIPGFQPLGILRETVDADLLCGNADPGIAAQGFGGGGTEFEARRHVQPETRSPCR